jgi:hypothetical protein
MIVRRTCGGLAGSVESTGSDFLGLCEVTFACLLCSTSGLTGLLTILRSSVLGALSGIGGNILSLVQIALAGFLCSTSIVLSTLPDVGCGLLDIL